MKRVFIAIPVPDEFRLLFERLKDKNSMVENMRWTREANYHATVYFIGNVDDDSVQVIRETVEHALTEIHAFELFPEKIMLFPPDKPRMLWLRFRRNEKFRNLYDTCRYALSEKSIEGDMHKDPVPHITLARMKGIVSRNSINLGIPPTTSLQVNQCRLYESVQSSEGVLYKSIATFQLSEK